MAKAVLNFGGLSMLKAFVTENGTWYTNQDGVLTVLVDQDKPELGDIARIGANWYELRVRKDTTFGLYKANLDEFEFINPAGDSTYMDYLDEYMKGHE